MAMVEDDAMIGVPADIADVGFRPLRQAVEPRRSLCRIELLLSLRACGIRCLLGAFLFYEFGSILGPIRARLRAIVFLVLIVRSLSSGAMPFMVSGVIFASVMASTLVRAKGLPVPLIISALVLTLLLAATFFILGHSRRSSTTGSGVRDGISGSSADAIPHFSGGKDDGKQSIAF